MSTSKTSKFYLSRAAAAATASTIAVSLLLCTASSALARGGGGGGGRGGGFGGGRGGDFAGFNRGFDNRAGDYYGGRNAGDFGRAEDYASRADGLAERPYGAAPRASESDLRAGADHTYNFPDSRSSFPTDGGFSHVNNYAAGAGYSRTNRIAPQDLAMQANNVRNAFNDNGMFRNDWWARNANAWRYPYWGNDWGWGYGYGGWGDMCGFWGLPVDTDLPEYDYGNNITYENNEVYYGTTPSYTADQYYQQAQTLADTASPTSALVAAQPPLSKALQSKQVKGAGDWKSLGVFSLTQGAQTNSTSVFQLAVDKKGIIRGNYENCLTGEVTPVQGAVDKKSMRAAWTVGKNKTVVYDTGLSNLMTNQSSVLVHFNKDKTEQWNLVRLDPPKTAAPKST